MRSIASNVRDRSARNDGPCLLAQIEIEAKAAGDFFCATLEEDFVTGRVVDRRLPAVGVVFAHVDEDAADTNSRGDQIGEFLSSPSFLGHGGRLRSMTGAQCTPIGLNNRSNRCSSLRGS